MAFIRSTVLAPLAQLQAGLECKGLRRLEQQLPLLAAELRHTTGDLTPRMLFSALEKRSVCIFSSGLRFSKTLRCSRLCWITSMLSQDSGVQRAE